MAWPHLLVLCLVLPSWSAADPADKETDGAPQITELNIVSRITARYARTTVNSWVLNPASTGKEVTFDVQLPESAFISAFSMTVRNKTYPGIVKEKTQAKQAYTAAVKRGWSAGLVATKKRDTEQFTVSVNVGAKSRALFTLGYEELLQRKLQWYEHAVSVRPQQTVENLTVEVFVEEKAGLSRLAVPHLRTSNLISNDVNAHVEAPPATTITRTPTTAVVRFQPSVEEQKKLAKNGVLGDFIVRYDVERTEEAGEVEIMNGYFAHFFAPRQLSVLPKNIVFVIDVSGSMSGTKMRQTKKAMKKILNDLRPKDHLNIVTFSYGTNTWTERGLVKSTTENIQSAQKFVQSMVADGGTNIQDALSVAVNLLKQQEVSKEMSVPLVILLTDGQPTVGETNEEVIIKNARSSINSLYSLYCLGFGQDVMFDFLEKLALPNSGFARKIFEDVDAELQLKGFYDEVGTPLLSKVVVKYSGNEVDGLTQTSFSNYFSGSEIVVAGRVRGDAGSLVATVEGQRENGTASLSVECVLPPRPPRPPPRPLPPRAASHTERLWAFLTIKQLLKEKISATDDAEKQRIDNETLALSLRYGFVTPLTSMVVTVPDAAEGTPGGDEPSPTSETSLDSIDDADAPVEDDLPDANAKVLHSAGFSVVDSPQPVQRGIARHHVHSILLASLPMHPGSVSAASRMGAPGMPGMMPIHQSPPMAGGYGFSQMRPAPPPPATMVSKMTTSRTSIAPVDPPTVLHFPSKNMTLCFSSYGSDGEILTLLEDPVTGLSVKATVEGTRRSNRQSYSEVSIHVASGHGDLEFRVNATGLHLNWPSPAVIPLQHHSSVQLNNVNVQVEAKKAVIVKVAGGTEIRVLFSGPRYTRRLFLYVMDPHGLSTATTGLLGGLLHKDVELLPPTTSPYPGLSSHLTRLISIGSSTLSVMTKPLNPLTSASLTTCFQTDFAVLGS